MNTPTASAQNILTMYPLEHAVQEGRYRDALHLLEKLLDVVPEHVEAQQQRVRLYGLMNTPLDALQESGPSSSLAM